MARSVCSPRILTEYKVYVMHRSHGCSFKTAFILVNHSNFFYFKSRVPTSKRTVLNFRFFFGAAFKEHEHILSVKKKCCERSHLYGVA